MNPIHEYLRRRNALRSLEGELEMEIAGGRGRSEKADRLRHQIISAGKMEAEAGKLIAEEEAIRFELYAKHCPEKLRAHLMSVAGTEIEIRTRQVLETQPTIYEGW